MHTRHKNDNTLTSIDFYYKNYQIIVRYTTCSVVQVVYLLRVNSVINNFMIAITMPTNYWKYTTPTTAPTARLHLDRVLVVCMFSDVVWLQTAGTFGVRSRSSVRAVRWRDRRALAHSWPESTSSDWLWITQTYVFVFLNSIICHNVLSTNWR